MLEKYILYVAEGLQVIGLQKQLSSKIKTTYVLTAVKGACVITLHGLGLGLVNSQVTWLIQGSNKVFNAQSAERWMQQWEWNL